MMNLLKYRRFILVTFLVIVVSAFLTLAAVWNSLLTVQDIRNEGWIIVFLIILIIAVAILFYFALKLSDNIVFQESVDKLIATEKEKLLKKMEEKKSQTHEAITEESDLSFRIDKVLSGLKSVKTIETFANKLLMNISSEIEIVRGVFFYSGNVMDTFACKGEYALTGNKPASFKLGENLTGQVAKNRTLSSFDEIPADYFKAESGLGGTVPRHLIIFPMVYKEKTLAVIELATFKKIDSSQMKILNTLISELGERLNKFVSA
jgi:hypothetical protein